VRYIPNEYWFERGKKYKDEFRHNKNSELQEGILIDYLKNIPSSFSTVLEVGCGFGRITKLVLSNFPNILEYVAIDLSPDQLENAKEFVKSAIYAKERNPLNFIVSDIQSFHTPWNAAPHNFIHQYEKIYRNMPTVSNVYRIPIVKRGSWFRSLDTKQSLFHACKKH